MLVAAGLVEALRAAPVSGHTVGPGAEGPLWGAWSADPRILLPAALLMWCYVRGLAAWGAQPQRRRHPRWKTVFFFGGMAVGLLALLSPIDRAAEHEFSFHMIQHELLLMFAVPMVLLGAPVTPLLLGLPRALRMGMLRALARRHGVRRAWSVLTHPITALGTFTAVLWLWHLAPGWYDAAVRHEPVHFLQHMTFLLGGGLLWWNVIDPAPLRARMNYLLRVLYVLVGTTPKHILAAMLTFAGHPFYDAYTQATPLIGLTPGEDQVLGGLIMWVPSQMMMLLVAAMIFFLWARRSEAEQRAREATTSGASAARARIAGAAGSAAEQGASR